MDDLDRCSADDALRILAIIHLFLSVERSVILAGVDFARLEQAWRVKYGYSKVREEEQKIGIDDVHNGNRNYKEDGETEQPAKTLLVEPRAGSEPAT